MNVLLLSKVSFQRGFLKRDPSLRRVSRDQWNLRSDWESEAKSELVSCAVKITLLCIHDMNNKTCLWKTISLRIKEKLLLYLKPIESIDFCDPTVYRQLDSNFLLHDSATIIKRIYNDLFDTFWLALGNWETLFF